MINHCKTNKIEIDILINNAGLLINKTFEEITVEADNLEDAKRKVDLADNEDWEVVYSEGVDLVCVCTPAMRDEIEDAEVIIENADKYQAIKSDNADFFTQKL